MTRAKTSKSCGCIARVNKLIRDRNTSLVSTLEFKGHGPSRCVIRTEIVEKKRGARPCAMIANFCPFCGKGYGA